MRHHKGMSWKSVHYNPKRKRFQNQNGEPTRNMNTPQNFLKILNQVILHNSPDRYPRSPIGVIKPNLDEFVSRKDFCGFIWFGHSTVLLNHFGTTILFDPVFFNAAPVNFLVSRFSPIICKPEEIPKIDFLVLSHDHYDHMDAKALAQLDLSKTVFLTSLGVKARILDLNLKIAEVHELDWWESIRFNEFQFTFTPAQHFSGRGLLDRDKTLWGSWCMKTPKASIFFSGDSGYNSHFKEIGERCGPFDLAMIETGQYNPLWKAVHMLPKESVQAAVDVQAEVMLPIHWGAYSLSTHAWYDPAEQVLAEAKLNPMRLVIPKIGETVDLKSMSRSEKWW